MLVPFAMDTVGPIIAALVSASMILEIVIVCFVVIKPESIVEKLKTPFRSDVKDCPARVGRPVGNVRVYVAAAECAGDLRATP